MSDHIGRFPYQRVQFKKDGTIHDEEEVSSLLKRIKEEAWDKAVFVAHGWNNNIEEAERLHHDAFRQCRFPAGRAKLRQAE